MLLTKKGYPEEDELILCTVTKIFPHGAFVKLGGYDSSGMIHISEISPGRIRNIRDYVKEGKKIVCKVLRINQEKGHIDLSLRRVNEGQKREKINEVKQEQKAEKIIEFAARKFGKDPIALYKDLYATISKKYDLLHDCFEDIVKEKQTLEKLGVGKEIADVLTEAIKERMKPPVISVEGELTLHSYSPDGIGDIKKSLACNLEGGEIEVAYFGGGKYRVKVEGEEYKDAEKTMDSFTENVIKSLTKAGGTGEFAKGEK